MFLKTVPFNRPVGRGVATGGLTPPPPPCLWWSTFLLTTYLNTVNLRCLAYNVIVLNFGS